MFPTDFKSVGVYGYVSMVVFCYKYLVLIPIQWYGTKMGLLKLCTYLIGCFVWQDIHVVSENCFCLLNIWVNKFHLKFHHRESLIEYNMKLVQEKKKKSPMGGDFLFIPSMN